MVVYDTRTGDTHVISSDAIEMLRLCDGRAVHTEDFLVFFQSTYPDEGGDVLESFVETSVNDLVAYGLLNAAG